MELPMMMFVTVCPEDEGFVAHALNFDIVSVAATEDEAMEKVRLAVKTYIEYGLNNHLEADILYPAPEEFWNKISQDAPIKMMEPITVKDKRLLVVSTVPTHGTTRPVANVA
jgi:hypothetical protein